MKVKTLVPWYGSGRMIGTKVGELLQGCNWVGIPFAGGCCELAHIPARTIVANDLHRHLINLARVVADPEKCQELKGILQNTLFHSDVLREAQNTCRLYETEATQSGDIHWALNYFICCWMSRSETAGTTSAFDQKLSVRWNAGGGDSVVRFRSAIDGLDTWSKIFQETSATFVTLDAFEFLQQCKDRDKHGIYCDAPFPKGGEKYTYNPGRGEEMERWHANLAARLATFRFARVVCRFHEHPMVRELYPESEWHYTYLDGRAQTNEARDELLIVRNP